MAKLFYISCHIDRKQGKQFEAVPAEEAIRNPVYIGRRPQTKWFRSEEDLRSYVEGNGDILVEWSDPVVVAVVDHRGRVGFPQIPYPKRTSFVGPENKRYDIIIPDRSNPPLVEGGIYRIGNTVRRIEKQGKRSLRFVKVERLDV